MKSAVLLLLMAVVLPDTLRAAPADSNYRRTLSKLIAVLEEYKRGETLERLSRAYGSGVTLSGDAKTASHDIVEGKNRYVIYKIEGNQIIVDTILERSNENKFLSEEGQWNQFTQKLIGSEPRYAIFEIDHGVTGQRNFIEWIPTGVDRRTRMMYASYAYLLITEDSIHIRHTIRAEKASDLNWDVLEKMFVKSAV